MIYYWFLAIRPKTLAAAIIPVFVATSLAQFNNFKINWWVSLFALFSSLFIQIATNFFNDAIDFDKGADSETRVGPKRATQSGWIDKKAVYRAGYISLFLAFIFGIPLVAYGGWVIVLIGVISLFLGYAYTGGPYPLAYKGLGDLFVYLFFGLIAVGGVYYLQTHTYDWSSFWLGSQVGLTATVLIAINNLRDREEDKKVNKKTLSVRIGENFSKLEIIFLYFSSLGIQVYWYKSDVSMFWLPLTILPLIVLLIVKLLNNKPGYYYNKLLSLSGIIHIIFGLLLSVSLWN